MQRIEYNALLSSNPIAVHKLKPLPAVPLGGLGMEGSPFGVVVAALCNASFSASRIDEVIVELYGRVGVCILRAF